MLDLSSCCRTCMKDNVTLNNLYGMVKIEENCLQLADMLVLCTSIQISKEDGLPQKLCDECAKVLHIAYGFRNQAANSQEQFKKLLENDIKSELPELKTENDHNYFDTFEDFGIVDDIAKLEGNDMEHMCDKCNKTFLTEKKLNKHLNMHILPLECSICKKSYQNQASLDKHITKHYKTYTCAICKRNYETEHLLSEHMVEHSKLEIKIENEAPEPSFKCSDCDLIFTKQRSLSMHMRKHKNKKDEFICNACGKVFRMKNQLKRHVAIHSAIKPYKCSNCSKSYARKDQLMNHMRSHKDSKPYECSYCKKGFTQLCSLKDHIRSHTGETPYLCSECGKGFTNNSNLRQHMMRHTGLKPFACNMCPKTFCTKGQMTSHITTHTGVHPYKCEKCSATFTKQNSLKKHSLIHLGVRPFACDTCNMRFTCKDHLKRHYRIHTGEKPYRCQYCERAFSQSNDLVKHTRAHVGQNIYQCTICSMKFRLMSELKSHYPTHFVDGKLQAPEPNESIVPIKLSSASKDLEPLLILKPPETELSLNHDKITTDKNTPIISENHNRDIPIISENHNRDIPMLSLNHTKGKESPLTLKYLLERDMPLFTLKPSFAITNFDDVPEIKEEQSRYIVTINSCDKSGLVNGITIDLPTTDS